MADDPHNRARQVKKNEDDDEDPVDKMMEKIGCGEQHYQVQLCMMENRGSARTKSRTSRTASRSPKRGSSNTNRVPSYC